MWTCKRDLGYAHYFFLPASVSQSPDPLHHHLLVQVVSITISRYGSAEFRGIKKFYDSLEVTFCVDLCMYFVWISVQRLLTTQQKHIPHPHSFYCLYKFRASLGKHLPC